METVTMISSLIGGLIANDYSWVSLIGLLVGVTELAARYRDSPARAIFNGAATLYVLINVLAGCLALFLVREVFHWDFGIQGEPEGSTKLRWVSVLASGVGAMAFFRSSLFTFRVGDKDVPLGPGIILQVLLDITDREVDRSRARPRAAQVAAIMKEVEFSKAEVALPAYCFALMQNVSTEEQAAFAKTLAQLGAASMPVPVKTLTLGLALMNLVGDAVLDAAVKTLGSQITQPPMPVAVVNTAPPVSTATPPAGSTVAAPGTT